MLHILTIIHNKTSIMMGIINTTFTAQSIKLHIEFNEIIVPRVSIVCEKLFIRCNGISNIAIISMSYVITRKDNLIVIYGKYLMKLKNAITFIIHLVGKTSKTITFANKCEVV